MTEILKGLKAFHLSAFARRFFFFFPVLVYGFDAQSDQMLV